jgi:hypothetical protein
MDWIKKNSDQFALIVFASGLIACAGLISQKTDQFELQFAAAQVKPVHKVVVPSSAELVAVKTSQQTLEQPGLWSIPKDSSSLFVAKRHVVDLSSSKYPQMIKGGMFHPPVPNEWLLEHGIEPVSDSAISGDHDKDGFTTLEEFLGKDPRAEEFSGQSTDPSDPKSHPPYYTKLFFKKLIKEKFELVFNAVTSGNPKKDKIEKLVFQVASPANPFLPVSVGQTVRDTTFKVVDFRFKEAVSTTTGGTDDVSELTLTDTATGTNVVLILGQQAEKPIPAGKFTYLNALDGKRYWEDKRLTKLESFSLPPEDGVKYKLIDITETGALIALPSGKTYKIPLLPPPPPK